MTSIEGFINVLWSSSNSNKKINEILTDIQKYTGDSFSESDLTIIKHDGDGVLDKGDTYTHITWKTGETDMTVTNNSAINNKLECTNSSANYDRGSYSTIECASGDCSMKFTDKDTTQSFYIGLTEASGSNQTDKTPSSIDFSVLVSGSVVRVFVGNVNQDISFVRDINAEYEIKVEGADVLFYINDILMHTEVAPTITYPLMVDTSFSSTNSVSNVSVSGTWA